MTTPGRFTGCDVRGGKSDKGLTAETQRGYAATKTRNISRKDAKHVLSNVEGAAKKLNFRTWRSWRLGASKSPFWIAKPRGTGKVAQAAKL